MFDLTTFIFQIVNFLILVALLRISLYKPIINAMDKREETIASRLKDAKQKRDEAQAEAESYREQQKELRDKQEEILTKAKEDAEAHRKELMARAREEAEEAKAKWHDAVRQQKESFLADLRRRGSEQIYAITRRVLKDLANDDLERHIIDNFISRIQNMNEDEKKAIDELSRDSQAQIAVNSAFEIPEEMRKQIADAVRARIAGNPELQFKVLPDLISGIELNANGRKIAWSFESYLSSLEEEMAKAIEEGTREEEPMKNGKIKKAEEKPAEKTVASDAEDKER